MNSNANCGFDEKNHLVEKLKEKLKTKEKELCEIRIRLCECKDKCNGLNETNQMLETDLKSLNTNFADVKSSAVRKEEKLTSERDSLSNELEVKCRQLSDLEARYEDEKRDAKNQKCEYNKLFMTLTEVNKASVQNHYEMKNEVHKLKKEICIKKEELNNLKNKIKELEQENNFSVMEINGYKNKVFELECRLKQLVLVSDNASCCL